MMMMDVWSMTPTSLTSTFNLYLIDNITISDATAFSDVYQNHL